MKFNIAEGDVLHSPNGSWTIECHADSKNMTLSKPASIHPTETISPCVLGSHRETFTHPTGCAVNGSLNFAFSLSVSHSPPPPPLTALFSWLEMKVNHHILTWPVPQHHSQHSRRAFCNRLTSEFNVVCFHLRYMCLQICLLGCVCLEFHM